MRHRFTPNVTPRASRRSSATTDCTDTSTALVRENTVESEQTIPFIPPNSSITTGDITCEEIEPLEDTNSVVVIEKVTDTVKSKQANPKKSKSCKENSNATNPATARRCRIRPSVTPKPRKRNKAGKDASNNDNTGTTQQTCSSIISDVVVDKDNENDASVETPSKEQVTNPEVMETSTVTATESTTDPSPSVPQTPTPTKASTSIADTSEDGKTSGNNLSLSRRRRATPKICIPTRTRRTTSVSKEGTEKSDSLAETTQPQQQSDGATALEKVTSDDTVDNAAKRPRLQPEVVQEDVGVLEVTVEAEEETQQDVPDDEEQVEVEEEETPTSKKIKGRKRKTPIRKPKEMLDPSRMTLQDLIYFNPKGNHMKSSVDAKKKKMEQQKRKSNQSTGNQNNDTTVEGDDRNTENQSNNQQTTDNTDGGGDSSVCAPQVKIGADGCIILDEESLVIRSPINSTLEDKDIIYEDAGDLNFDFSTKLKGKKAKWSMQDTLKFYKVLSQVGTDFQLMAPLFPMRSRKELKAKFKREEKTHYHLVDKALVYRTPISLEMFLKEQKDQSKNSKSKEENQASNAAYKEVVVLDSL